MLAQQRYNEIIKKVEEIAEARSKEFWEPSPDPQDVSHTAFEAGECDYIDGRSKSEVFKFLTGMTFNQYVNSRLMMRAYKVLLEQNVFNSSELINILGVSSDASLYKKFKETFGLSPREAFDRKISSLYREPSYWNTLSNEGQDMFIRTVEVIKEVPVEVVKPDRRPYIIIAVIAAVLVIVFLVGIRIKTISKWAGKYIMFDYMFIEGTDIPYLTLDAAVDNSDSPSRPTMLEIKPFSRKAVPNENLNNFDIGIESISKNSIVFHFTGINDFTSTGILKDDGTILFDFPQSGKRYMKTVRLVREEDYEAWAEQWDGIYSIQYDGDSSDIVSMRQTLEGDFYSIYISGGVFAELFLDPQTSAVSSQLGYITDFNGQYLDFIYPGTLVQVRCISNGSAGFMIPFTQINDSLPDNQKSDDVFDYYCVRIGSFNDGADLPISHNTFVSSSLETVD